MIFHKSNTAHVEAISVSRWLSFSINRPLIKVEDYVIEGITSLRGLYSQTLEQHYDNTISSEMRQFPKNCRLFVKNIKEEEETRRMRLERRRDN